MKININIYYKKFFYLFLRIIVSLVILYFIFLKIDFKNFLSIFSRVNYIYVVLAFSAYLLQFLISTIKWQKLVNFFITKINFKFFLKFNLIGLFYATIMPGGLITGDMIKGYKVFRVFEDKKTILNSILMDRITGFTGLLISIILIIIFIFQSYKFPYHSAITLISVILLLLISVFLFFSKAVFGFLSRIIKRFVPKIKNFSEKIFGAINTYSNNLRLLVFAVLVGILIYFINTFCVYFAALALSINVSFINLFAVNCLAMFALIIAPITFSGFGIREGFFVYFLGLIGTGKESAVALSLLCGLIYLLFGLVGGVLEVIMVFKKRT
ncbi:flippase-like domain-containing protein [Patescibacteria group bacterium]|nr:flippase-like domain-containing protein [Patescibacteria group bacterium]